MSAALSIFLIGMMGAGKSTVGVRLARRLDRPFIDVDRELECRLGVDIPTVFDLEGEDGFRRREAQLIEELTAARAAWCWPPAAARCWRPATGRRCRRAGWWSTCARRRPTSGSGCAATSTGRC